MSLTKRQKYDCVIIGGGFFGAYLALYLQQKYPRVLILEQEGDLLLRASLNNQARVHNGYHYPRALGTALSSARHFRRFCDEFKEAICSDFSKYYAIASLGSKTSSRQFYRLFRQFHIPIESAPNHIKAMFDTRLVSDVFAVREYAFNANVLRKILKSKLEHVEIAYNTRALSLKEGIHTIKLSIERKEGHNEVGDIISAPLVINSTYAGINALLSSSALPTLPLKYEYTEMALVSVPSSLKGFSFTLMDGAFFSLMPYPARECYTLSHVRYTPHCAWNDAMYPNANPYEILSTLKQSRQSNFPLMKADSARYLPALAELSYHGSLYEIKTLQLRNEIDDGRPIVFAKDYGIKGFCTIMGGKIDNIYEIMELIKTEGI